MKLQTTEARLAPEFKLRAARMTDADAVSQLVLEVCTADGDPTIAYTTEELLRFWTGKDFNLDTDAWVVESSDGQLVGYQEFFNQFAHAALRGDGYVHPKYWNRGIGTAMLRRLDERARDELQLADPDLRVFIRNGMSMSDKEAHELHENEGYKPARYSWRMEIKLEAPPVPQWPDGIELRPFVLTEHNRAVFEADDEAFADHWGHTPGSFERWQHHVSGAPEFDPSLWFIAWDADQVAGVSLCRYRMGIGWVGSLGVRRPWRKRGLGLALLQHSFGEFYRRGQPIVGLGVDAANPTGATRLYKRAGMQVANEYVLYEKEFRAGREPSGDE